jgi:hypothetical protein
MPYTIAEHVFDLKGEEKALQTGQKAHRDKFHLRI